MVGVTEETSHGLGDESEKRMEEEIICNRWKDLADERTGGPSGPEFFIAGLSLPSATAVT